MRCEPNLFKQKLYDEFEQNSYKVLGVLGNRVIEVPGKLGENIDADFEAAWDYGGASFMRISMSMVLSPASLRIALRETQKSITLPP